MFNAVFRKPQILLLAALLLCVVTPQQEADAGTGSGGRMDVSFNGRPVNVVHDEAIAIEHIQTARCHIGGQVRAARSAEYSDSIKEAREAWQAWLGAVADVIESSPIGWVSDDSFHDVEIDASRNMNNLAKALGHGRDRANRSHYEIAKALNAGAHLVIYSKSDSVAGRSRIAESLRLESQNWPEELEKYNETLAHCMLREAKIWQCALEYDAAHCKIVIPP